jgi:hypothetical protein
MGYSLTDSSTNETNSNPSQLRLRRQVRVSIWPSRDPIGERGGINLYGFVGNDGVNRWDLLGHQGPDLDAIRRLNQNQAFKNRRNPANNKKKNPKIPENSEGGGCGGEDDQEKDPCKSAKCACESTGVVISVEYEILKNNILRKDVFLYDDVKPGTHQCPSGYTPFLITPVYGDVVEEVGRNKTTYGQKRPEGCENCPKYPDGVSFAPNNTHANKWTEKRRGEPRTYCQPLA